MLGFIARAVGYKQRYLISTLVSLFQIAALDSSVICLDIGLIQITIRK